MLEPNFTPFPELSTPRLSLRRLRPEDAPEIFFLRSDQTVMQYLSKEPIATMKEAGDFIERINQDIDKNEAILWGIVLKENPDKVIGNIGFWRMVKEHYRAELGYTLHPACWRKGIMKESILAALEYGYYVMRLHSVEARINPENLASASVLEATGFVREGFFKEDFFRRGKFEDTAVYSRLR